VRQQSFWNVVSLHRTSFWFVTCYTPHFNTKLWILQSKGEEIIEGWRKEHNNGLHHLYSSSNITRVINSRGIMSQTHGIHKAKVKTYRTLFGKTWWKEMTETPRCRWKDNIKIKLKGITWEGMNWIYLLQNNKWLVFLNTENFLD
jgi:hypothetical protein